MGQAKYSCSSNGNHSRRFQIGAGRVIFSAETGFQKPFQQTAQVLGGALYWPRIAFLMVYNVGVLEWLQHFTWRSGLKRPHTR